MTQTKFKRVPFDIELAKKITNKEVEGRIVNGNGKEVRIICFDKMRYYPIIALAKMPDGVEDICTYTANGRSDEKYKSNLDLHIEVSPNHLDYSNFQPQKWQTCLVRDEDYEDWKISVCAGRNKLGKAVFYNYGGGTVTWVQVLPLSNITERLICTTQSYEELIQELDAELN